MIFGIRAYNALFHAGLTIGIISRALGLQFATSNTGQRNFSSTSYSISEECRRLTCKRGHKEVKGLQYWISAESGVELRCLVPQDLLYNACSM